MTLGKRTDYGDAKFAGLEVEFPTDVEKAVQVPSLPHAKQVLRQIECGTETVYHSAHTN